MLITTKQYIHTAIMIVEFLGKSLTQTNKTKQMFIRLYYLDCWTQIIQSDKQNKCSTKCIIVQIVQFDELLFCSFRLICLVGEFPKNSSMFLGRMESRLI